MSQTKPLLPPSASREPPHVVSMRWEYRGLFVAALLLGMGLTFALVFGLRPVDLTPRITALETSGATLQATSTHLETELMGLLLNSVTFTTRYVQNGTCKFGFPLGADSAPQTVADLSDYVDIEYSLREVYFSASVPSTTLTFAVPPRPITFLGYTPTITQPRRNELTPQIALCDPPIATLDTLSQNFDLLPYSYTVASRIEITPNCVAASVPQHDSAHCTEENGYSPYYASSYPTPNSFQIFPNNLETPGSAVLQLVWGQWDYTSFGNQYDFVGTNVSFSAPLEMLLPNV